jgi:hypothetical protein
MPALMINIFALAINTIDQSSLVKCLCHNVSRKHNTEFMQYLLKSTTDRNKASDDLVTSQTFNYFCTAYQNHTCLDIVQVRLVKSSLV